MFLYSLKFIDGRTGQNNSYFQVLSQFSVLGLSKEVHNVFLGPLAKKVAGRQISKCKKKTQIFTVIYIVKGMFFG